MKIMSFNLKDDGIFFISDWKIRLDGFVKIIKDNKPDIIGTQEMTYKAFKRLNLLLKQNNLKYNFYGESRKRNNRIFDEYNTILVRDGIKVIDSYTYSLSNTPIIPKSKFPNDKFPRIMTYIETSYYYVYNTHLTNKVDENKFLQLKCITKLLKRDKPVIIIGDFNLGVNRLKDFCLKNNLIDTTKEIGNTFESKDKKYHLDHILVDSYVGYKNVVKYTDKYKKKRISDHYPISVEIEIKKKSK